VAESASAAESAFTSLGDIIAFREDGAGGYLIVGEGLVE
jgi:hypothetical protein